MNRTGQPRWEATLKKHVLFALALLVVAAACGDGTGRGGASDAKKPTQSPALCEVPARPFGLILGRPSARSVTVSVLCRDDASGVIAYGTRPGLLDATTPPQAFKQGVPREVVLPGLLPDSRYYYQLRFAQTNSSEYSFHTARRPGSAFAFTVTADPHLDENTDPRLYRQTLAQALAGGPDFHIDLGDTFMTEKHASRESAARQYLAQRDYFGQLCHSAPLFLVLGNHDGETPRGRGGEADSLTLWSCLTRKAFFPNPVPDGFYTGNAAQHPEAGPLQDYYAWEWGDALFVVLAPYWFTQAARGQADNWKRTLGDEQYRWLTRTLEGSRAKFRFVFIHHLVGGSDEQARGGEEAAPFYEWGGNNADGTDGFAAHRPGWPLPIHQLLVHNRVSVVFHGHDHLFAQQERDGLVYQACPQPGDPRGSTRRAADYGYASGVLLGSSGHLRVDVSPARATVSYIRGDGTAAHAYTVQPRP